MTKPEQTWYLLNIYKDIDLENQKYQQMLMSMNPFIGKQGGEVVTKSTEFTDDIEKYLGRELTPEEQDALDNGVEIDFIG